MGLIFLFVDGLGLGKDCENNPFSKEYYHAFHRMTCGQPFFSTAEPFNKSNVIFKPIDACLGVDGLPQSGTGQLSLFSGYNAAKTMGRHFGPWPPNGQKQMLREKSLFRRWIELGGSCYFMNAFPKQFIEYHRIRNRWPCSALMAREAGLSLNGEEEVISEVAVTPDILQDIWKSRISNRIPVITEKRASERVIRMAHEKDLVLVEYYLTDKAGHSCDWNQARMALSRLNRFLDELVTNGLKAGHTLLLTSDHGNIEDLSTKGHTLNKVPLFVQGNGIELFRGIHSITDVTPACEQWYRLFGNKGRQYSAENLIDGSRPVNRPINS